MAALSDECRQCEMAEAQNDEPDRRTMKRQRMDRLIQMSLEFVGVHEPHASPSPCTTGADPQSNEELQLNGRTTTTPTSDSQGIRAAASSGQRIARKRTWSAAEDAKLKDLVVRLGQDWAAIAHEFQTRDRKRCRERYINHLSPALTHAQWTKEEDAKLLALYDEIGSHWARVADRMPARSPENVKYRWLQLTSDETRDHENTRAQPQRWTVSETEALMSLVEANGAKDWFFIASQIPGRTDLQCRQHWYRVLAPNIIKGRATWKKEEDEILRAKVDELGRQWEKIAAFLPGRLGKQCRERYVNHLDDSIVTSPWTENEDVTLISAHNHNPHKWSKIAEQLPGRTENAIKNRWNSIRRKLVITRSDDG